MKQIIILFSVLVINFGFSQQEPQFTMFWNNYSMFNPANTGLNNTHFGSAVYRSQWDKIENAPNTFTGQYEYKSEKYNSGFGLGYMRDEIFVFGSNRVYLNYAYHSKNKFLKARMSYGVSLFYDYMEFKPQWIVPDGGDPSLDPNLPQQSRQGKLNLNLGVVMDWDKLTIGISSTQINQAKYDNLNITKSRHYFTYASYDVKLSKQFDLIPRINFQTDGNFMALGVSTQLIFQKKYWAGITYRSQDAIGFQLGADFKEKFRVGYSYDYLTSKLTNYSSGSHEIVLAIIIK